MQVFVIIIGVRVTGGLKNFHTIHYNDTEEISSVECLHKQSINPRNSDVFDHHWQYQQELFYNAEP